jgi:Na+-translocating ferredoxin:NAD+ oxidoreductase RnfG subunit
MAFLRDILSKSTENSGSWMAGWRMCIQHGSDTPGIGQGVDKDSTDWERDFNS